MDRDRLPGGLAIATILAAVGAVAIVLARLGLVPLNAIAEAGFDVLLGSAAAAIAAILVLMYPDSRVVRLFHGKKSTQILVAPRELSEDKRKELLTRHLALYRDLVLVPIGRAGVRPRASISQMLRGGPEPWDDLLVSYDPRKELQHSSDLESFEDHLRHDVAGYDGGVQALTRESLSINAEAEAWLARIGAKAAHAIDGFGEVEREGRFPRDGPFVSFPSARHRLVRVCRDMYARMPVDADPTSFTPEWPAREELVPIRTGDTGDILMCDNETLARLAPGVTAVRLQESLASAAADPSSFRDYATLRRRCEILARSVARFQGRLSEIASQVGKNEYTSVLPCCLAQMEPPAPGPVGLAGPVTAATLVLEPPRPTVELVPLPHKRGWRIPPDRMPVVKGQRTGWITDLDPVSDPEANEAYGSQSWDAAIPKVETIVEPPLGRTAYLKRTQTRRLVFKFGVVRVRISGAPAIGARARGTFYRVQGKGRSKKVGPAVGLGSLVWHSKAIAQKVLKDRRTSTEILENPVDGINDRINKVGETVVDINPGEFRDLPLFYMRNEYPAVFLCGEELGTVAGKSERQRVVRFEVELVVSAKNLPAPCTKRFAATARWDDFAIAEIL